MSKFIVTAKDKNKGNKRQTISQPLSKQDAQNMVDRIEQQNKDAIPKYRILTDFKIEPVNENIMENNVKEIIRQVIAEESEYQKFFRRALEKAGKSISEMSDEEKREFFNKVSSAWDNKKPKTEGKKKKCETCPDLNESKNNNKTKHYSSLDDFEKDANIGDIFYLGNKSQFDRATKKDFFTVKGKESDGSLTVSKGKSSKKYTIGADRYDDEVFVFESINESKNDNLYVVVSMDDSDSGFVVSMPAERKKAEKFLKIYDPPKGETAKVMQVKDARKIRYLAGKENLNETITESKREIPIEKVKVGDNVYSKVGIAFPVKRIEKQKQDGLDYIILYGPTNKYVYKRKSGTKVKIEESINENNTIKGKKVVRFFYDMYNNPNRAKNMDKATLDKLPDEYANAYELAMDKIEKDEKDGTYQRFTGKTPSTLKLDEENTINERDVTAQLQDIKAAVEAASSFMNVGKELKKNKIKYDFMTEPLPMYLIQKGGKKIAVANKSNVDGADIIVGDIAIGLLENDINEAKTIDSKKLKWDKNPKGEYIPNVHVNDYIKVDGKKYRVKAIWAYGDITIVDDSKNYKTINRNTKDINEASRRATDFFEDSKHGTAIERILKGKWDRKKVEAYLDKVQPDDDVKYARILNFIGNDIGLNTKKYDNKPVHQFEKAILDVMEDLYKDFVSENINEGATIALVDPNKNKYVKTIMFSGLNRDADKEVEKLDAKLSSSQKAKGFYWTVITLESVNESGTDIKVTTERSVGKFGIVVMQDETGTMRTAIMKKDKLNRFNRNKQEDINKLWKLAKKYKGKEINESFTKKQWKEFYDQSKREVDGKNFDKYEKKYGKLLDKPHIADAIKKSKTFDQFMKNIGEFENINEEVDEYGYWNTSQDFRDEFVRIFGKKNVRGWTLWVDDMVGTFYWDNPKSDYTIVATPFWEDSSAIPINVTDEDGNEISQTEIKLKPTFDFAKDAAKYIKEMAKFFRKYK